MEPRAQGARVRRRARCKPYLHIDMKRGGGRAACARKLLLLGALLLLPLLGHGRKSKKTKAKTKRSASPRGAFAVDPHALLQQGSEAMKAQEFAEAVDIYGRLREGARGTAGEAIALLQLGNAYGAWGKDDQAAAALVDVAAVAAADGRTLLQAGRRLQDLLGRSADAAPHFSRALAVADDDPELDARDARLGLALSLNAGSDLAQANEHWEILIESSKGGTSPVATDMDDIGGTEAPRLAYAHNLAALGEGAEALRHFGRTCAPSFCADWTGHVLSPAVAAALRPNSPTGRLSPADAALDRWHLDAPATSSLAQARAFRGVIGTAARAALHAGEDAYWKANAQLGEKYGTGYVSYYASAEDRSAPRNLMEQIALQGLLPLLPKETQARVVGVEYWAHRMDPHAFTTVAGQRQATAFGKGYLTRDVIPSHKFHFDSDDYLGSEESQALRRYPQYTCLVYADDGGGYGGATLVLDNALSNPGSPLAQQAWLSKPSTDYVTCFNGSLAHAVLPGVFEAGLSAEQRQERASLGQQRRSFNFAFWADSPCLDGTRDPTSCMKKRSGEQWDWETNLPSLREDLADQASGVTELVLPRVQHVWVPE